MIHMLEHHLLDHVYTTLDLGFVTLSITKHTLVMWIATAVILLLVGYVGRQFRSGGSLVPRGIVMNLIEGFVVYVREEMVYPIMGEDPGKQYLPLILTLFIFLLTCNLLGLIPTIAIPGTGITLYPSATVTGNPWINFSLAALVFLIGAVHAIINHGPIGYLTGFVPHGVPVVMGLLMWPIEVLGTFIRHAVLAIRLLANMLAGHAILFGILGSAVLAVEAIGSLGLGLMAGIAPILLGLLIYSLEILVAIIQAYVFTLLSIIFLDMQVSGH